MTRADLARYLNTRQSTVESWLKRDSIPAADTALKIAHFLHVPLEYLIEGVKPKEQESIQLSEYEKHLLEDVKDLTAEDKIELRAYIAMKKSMYMTLKGDNGNYAIVKDC